MPEELKTEPLSFVRPLDDAGDVRHDERSTVAQLDDAKVGRERCEWIVADLGSGRADHGEKRGLPGIRLANEPNVGNELELELEDERLAVLTRLPLAWAPVHRGREPGVPLAATPTLGKYERIALLQHLGNDFARVVIPHDCARRHRKSDVRTGVTRLVRATAMVSTFRFPLVAVGVIEQGCQIAVATH